MNYGGFSCCGSSNGNPENPFDQNLNTTDDVKFNAIDITETGTFNNVSIFDGLSVNGTSSLGNVLGNGGTFNSMTVTGLGSFGSVSSTGEGLFDSITVTNSGSFGDIGTGEIVASGLGDFGSVTTTGSVTAAAIGVSGHGAFGTVAATGSGTFGSANVTGSGTFGEVHSVGVGAFAEVDVLGEGKFDLVTAATSVHAKAIVMDRVDNPNQNSIVFIASDVGSVQDMYLEQISGGALRLSNSFGPIALFSPSNSDADFNGKITALGGFRGMLGNTLAWGSYAEDHTWTGTTADVDIVPAFWGNNDMTNVNVGVGFTICFEVVANVIRNAGTTTGFEITVDGNTLTSFGVPTGAITNGNIRIEGRFTIVDEDWNTAVYINSINSDDVLAPVAYTDYDYTTMTGITGPIVFRMANALLTDTTTIRYVRAWGETSLLSFV